MTVKYGTNWGWVLSPAYYRHYKFKTIGGCFDGTRTRFFAKNECVAHELIIWWNKNALEHPLELRCSYTFIGEL